MEGEVDRIQVQVSAGLEDESWRVAERNQSGVRANFGGRAEWEDGVMANGTRRHHCGRHRQHEFNVYYHYFIFVFPF